MRESTPIYGRSRGYRSLAIIALLALILSVTNLTDPLRTGPVPIAGTIGFALLATYAWVRTIRRTIIMKIEDRGFSICDPACALGLLPYEEIEEIRIYATLERPMVGFRVHDSAFILRRTPAVMRVLLLPAWTFRRYQVVLELDCFNDQIIAIKSTALKAGIPVVSELV